MVSQEAVHCGCGRCVGNSGKSTPTAELKPIGKLKIIL